MNPTATPQLLADLWHMKTVPPKAELTGSIWRYTSIHSLLVLLNDRTLMFHQFQKLQESDEREGMIPEGFYESMLGGGEATKDVGEHNLELLRYYTYANCWHMSEHENALMWKAYAPGGIAIKTTVGGLLSAKIVKVMDENISEPGSQKLEQRTIEYADNWEELEAKGYQHGNIPLNRLFLQLKRNAFRAEAEVRFRIQPSAFPFTTAGKISFIKPEDCKSWCPVVFENLQWVEKVVTAPAIPKWAADAIRQVVERSRLTFESSRI